MANLPYVTSASSISKALKGIAQAATPPKVTQDFVKTVLQIRGGPGDQITAFLKKIGFANSDATPSELYIKFRNPTTSGAAAAKAFKIAYAPLYVRNEYTHNLNEADLRGLIVEETGLAHDSNVVVRTLATIKALREFCDFEANINEANDAEPKEAAKQAVSTIQAQAPSQPMKSDLGLNLSYTINLNLPATTDPAVFNAIFKSLKENLLGDGNE